MKNVFPSIAIFVAVLCANVGVYEFVPLPLNEFAYMLVRNQIKNINEVAKGLRDMTDKERLVNLYMEKLKSDEFEDTKDNFFASRPIEENLDKVQARPLYRLLKRLPKGGNMHMHEFQMLDRRRFLQMIKNSSEEYDMLYICDKINNPDCASNNCTCNQYFLKYFKKNVPPGWVLVKNSSWTIDSIVKATTLTGLLNSQEPKIYPTDSSARWKLANSIRVFDIYADLTRYNKTRFDYMKECLDSSLEENVQLLEFRRSMFGNLYYFDENGDEKPVDRVDQVTRLIQFKKEYIAQHPEFIDYIFIIYSGRGLDSNSIGRTLDDVIEFQKLYPDMIRGFDLVGEEDNGHTLLFHADTLIKGFNATYLSNNTFKYNFHASETNWPDDDNPAQYGDDVSTLDNSYDALVLKTHRIGHGIGFFKNPQLYDTIRKRKIAFEVCPTSNQILGYVSDLRNHPAINYIRSGIPIVFGGDDPGSFGYNEITVDIYLAYMAWGLNLHELKDIALNSIEYSTIPNELKPIGYQKFNAKWNSFINDLYSQACSETFTTKFNVTNVLPNIGPFNETNRVTVYGYGFEMALCKTLECVFGNVSVPAQLNHIREITCQTPLGFNANDQVRVQIRYDNNLYDTRQTYTFKTLAELKTPDDGDDMTTTPATTTTTTSNGIKLHSNFMLTILTSLMLILMKIGL